MTFLKWLREQNGRDDIVGDLAYDSMSPDSKMPKGSYVTLEQWKDYLYSKNVCRGAHEALREAWDEWLKN